jgi:ribosome-associated protein
LITLILNILQKNKALNILILEKDFGFTEKSEIIITTGTSFVHINSITKNLTIFLKKNFSNAIYTKSGANTDWVLIELENIIIHVMLKEARAYYDLESLYNKIGNDK